MPCRLARPGVLVAGVLAAWLVFVTPAIAQSVRAPQIGQPAPAFTLPDVNGKTIGLEEFKGKKNVLLVFYRGWIGYW